MKIKNVKIYGMDESIVASGLPKVAHLDKAVFSQSRAEKLGQSKIGSGHDNYLNGIIVQFDIVASQYFWQQLQRYHFIDFVSSMSKMHMITDIDLDNSCNRYVLPSTITSVKKLIKRHKNNEIPFEYVISNIPMGLELGARMTTNYRQLKTIYEQRKGHKLEEWKKFCEFIERLKNSKELGVVNGD